MQNSQAHDPSRVVPIHSFGDSHSRYFLQNPFGPARMKLKRPLRYEIRGSSIPAASVAGFRPGARTLNVKQVIRDALPEAERMILAFGQVDLELGYYYRLAIKGESHTPESYVDWLLNIYGDFLDILGPIDCDVALKGVNLTTLSPPAFAAHYVVRIIDADSAEALNDARTRLLPLILTETDQNAMHLNFNDGLRDLAERRGARYFDLVAETGTRGKGPKRLADIYRPMGMDHHLVDSVTVRRMHYIAAGKVFGLQDAADTAPA